MNKSNDIISYMNVVAEGHELKYLLLSNVVKSVFILINKLVEKTVNSTCVSWLEPCICLGQVKEVGIAHNGK